MIRQTRQRAAIEQVLREAGRPLSPNEIHEMAVKLLPGLGLRTVYRQIKDLSEAHLLLGVDYPGQPVRYELAMDGHIGHFICRDCDRVYYLQVEVPEVHIEEPEGFKITGQETIFYGVCPNCAQRGK
ncbi:MAG: transcriptional repressor [Verrucomicrobiota bacterium JB022]|nr:transcriptional repressor [Verrucomicrobiota bacterium JB022]